MDTCVVILETALKLASLSSVATIYFCHCSALLVLLETSCHHANVEIVPHALPVLCPMPRCSKYPTGILLAIHL